jgi:hypothetical protein
MNLAPCASKVRTVPCCSSVLLSGSGVAIGSKVRVNDSVTRSHRTDHPAGGQFGPNRRSTRRPPGSQVAMGKGAAVCLIMPLLYSGFLNGAPSG